MSTISDIIKRFTRLPVCYLTGEVVLSYAVRYLTEKYFLLKMFTLLLIQNSYNVDGNFSNVMI